MLCVGAEYSTDAFVKKQTAQPPAGGCAVCLQFAGLFYCDLLHDNFLQGAVLLIGGNFANGFDDVHAFDYMSEDGMFAVKPRAGNKGDEEL